MLGQSIRNRCPYPSEAASWELLAHAFVSSVRVPVALGGAGTRADFEGIILLPRFQ